MVHDKLIFDIGFHNGDDTAYYLSKGFMVVGVEANPELVQRGQERFRAEISEGRLTLLNFGVWKDSGHKLPFYVDKADSGHSSFDRSMVAVAEEVEVECVTLPDLFAQYGVPYFLKVDIEGADEAVISALTKCNAPNYVSCEMSHGSDILERLHACRYMAFKLINQETYTQSRPILQHHTTARFLRKLSRLGLKPLISALPLHRTEWEEKSKEFTRYSSGPFAEETEGPWRCYLEMKEILEHRYREHSKAGIENQFWFDLHAKR